MVLFNSCILSSSPRQQGDFLSFTVRLVLGRQSPLTTNPLLLPGALRIHMEDLPDLLALDLLYLHVAFSLTEPPTRAVTPWILHPQKLLSF